MTDNNLHDYLQSVYKPGHSKETELVKVQNDILTSIDQHGIVILTLLDQSSHLLTSSSLFVKYEILPMQ